MRANSNSGTLVYRLSDRATAELLVKEGYLHLARGLIIGHPSSPDLLYQFRDNDQLSFTSFDIGARLWLWEASHFDAMVNLLKNCKPKVFRFIITIDNDHETLGLFWHFLMCLFECKPIEQLNITLEESKTDNYCYLTSQSLAEMDWDFLHDSVPTQNFGLVKNLKLQFEHDVFTEENLTANSFTDFVQKLEGIFNHCLK